MIRILNNKIYTRPLIQKFSYHHRVIDHYNNPRNVGSFDAKDKKVGTGIVGSLACGDMSKIQIKVENGKIVETAFKTFGCGSAIAASSRATEELKNKSIEEALKITDKQLAEYLSLPPVKLHCSALAEDAIKKAIDDWKKKNN